MKKIQSTCNYCAIDCNLDFYVENNRIVKVVPTPGYTLNDLELSDTIIFIGSNPVVAHPILWGRVRQNRVPGHKVIVIDPRK